MMRLATYTGPLEGVDADTVMPSETEASCLYNTNDLGFIGRYISLQSTEQAGDLSTTELNNLLDGGWSVAIFQHAHTVVLNSSVGNTDGTNAVNNAKSIGVMGGAWLWVDIESYSSGSDPVGYAKAWASAVQAGGYVPALYYGAPGMDTSQVQSLLEANGGPFVAAWRGLGAPEGIGETLDQTSTGENVEGICGGTQYLYGPVDTDELLSGKSATFLAY